MSSEHSDRHIMIVLYANRQLPGCAIPDSVQPSPSILYSIQPCSSSLPTVQAYHSPTVSISYMMYSLHHDVPTSVFSCQRASNNYAETMRWIARWIISQPLGSGSRESANTNNHVASMTVSFILSPPAIPSCILHAMWIHQ